MLGPWRHLACLLLVAFGICAPAIAHAAWLETRVKSHAAIVDVDADGAAVVSTEFVLGVRGGPLRSLEIQGIDSDAELIEGASASPVVRYGVPAPIPLVLAQKEDGTLRIEVQRDRGLFTGAYSFRFAYRTNLLKSDRLRRRGPAAELEWVGPRFPDGIDVAKVVFRIPAGASEPALAGANEDGEGALGSTFLSAIRHEAGKVEVELVRPHVARGEPAIWRIQADPKVFQPLKESTAAPLSARAARVVPIERPSERAAWLGVATAIALIYALLIAGKTLLFERSARNAGALVRPLIPLRTALRAALGGAALAAAAVLGALGDHPLLASTLLFAAIALATLGVARLESQPRGPGRWFALTDAEAFDAPAQRDAARFLDAGRRPGFLIFGVLLAGFAGGATLVARHTAFGALAIAMAASSLIPIFASGRASFLPLHRVQGAARRLLALKSALTREGLKCVPWARIPDGGREPDELRVLVRLSRALEGFVAIEIGYEQHRSPGGYTLEPFVLVRVRDDSRAKRALGTASTWQRGRRSDERVWIQRPLLPTREHTLAVVRELCASLTDTSPNRSRSTAERDPKTGVVSPAAA